MKKTIILSFLFISCYSVERDCLEFRTGSFEFTTLINDSIVKSTFNRTDIYEIEEYKSVKDSSTIRWVNECEFILTKINPKTNQERRPIRIKILRTYGNSYDFEYSQVNNPQKINRGTVYKISD
ncbi:MAG: DNA topoisomerase IV [Flavobacteriaceae bacterium]